MELALIDYGAGNLHSVHKALQRAAIDAGISLSIHMGADPEIIAKADAIVLPGDGAFADCHAALLAQNGLYDALEEAVLKKARPFFGICVGMQLLAEVGEENGETKGLGWLKGRIVKLKPQNTKLQDTKLKVPHMGWNTLNVMQQHPVLNDLPLGNTGLHAYFLHSYHFLGANEQMLASADYGGPVTAIVGRDNIIGTQFHPEKSQALGLQLLSRFLKWHP